jgi:hypothetical protein
MVLDASRNHSSAFPRSRFVSHMASNSNSPKVHRRESCFATARIKPLSPPRHAEVMRLLYLSDEVASPSLPPHLAPGVRRCSAIALCLGGAFMFFGLPPSSFVANNDTLQKASAHSCPSRGVAAIPSFLTSPPSLLCFFVLVDAGSTHLNANKIKPLSARNATHSRVVTSHR